MSQDSALTSDERTLLLQELEEISHGISIFSFGWRGLRTNLSAWVALKLTTLMQKIGYNRRKIASLKGQEIILNIGCAGDTNNTLVNGDLFPSLGEMVKILTGKCQVEYDLFVDIASYDKNLSGIADGIVFSHVLEHIPSKLAILALKNCFAYLKPSGCIRISVPYLGAYDQPSSSTYLRIKNMLAKDRLIYCHGHQFMYNVDLLAFMMQKAGFSEIKQVNFQEGLLGFSDVQERQTESIYLTGLKVFN